MKNRFVKYKPAQLHITSSNWQVVYYVEHPQTKKLVRKRTKINYIQSKTARRQYAYQLIAEINKKLANGWNPYIEQEAPRAFELFIDVIEKFLTVKKKELRKSSIESYTSILKNFEIWLSKKYKIDKLYIYTIDSNVVRQYFDFLYIEKGITERTYNNYRSILVTIWNWLVENGYSKTNVFVTLKKKKNKKKTRIIIPRVKLEEIFLYLEEKEKHFLIAVYFTYFGLIRPNELMALKISDIDINNNIIIISPEISKTGLIRYVTVPEKLKKAYKELEYEKYNKTNYMFSDRFIPGTRKLSNHAVTAKWYRLREKLGFAKEYQFYSLKDTGIVHMLEAGVAPNIVRDQAGHTNIATTNKYIQNYLTTASSEIIKKLD